MDFLKYISTPKLTAEDAPKITTIKLTRGRLTGGFLFFPSGPAGLLHVIARVASHQILPYNTGEDFRLDACVVPFTLGIDLIEPPYEIDCVTWNDSTLYDHAITVCFSLTPRKRNRKILDTMENLFAGTKGYHKP